MRLKSFLRQIRLKGIIVFLLWAGFCLCFLSVCSKRKPTEPPLPKEYMVYASNTAGENQIYFISTLTDSIVDTTYVPGAFLLGISPDGYTLYVYSERERIFYEIDTRTKEIKYKGQNSGVYTTPDGKLILQPYGGIHFYDVCTHELIHHDTLTLYPPAFDRTSPLVYGGIGNGMVGVFNYQSFSWVKTFEVVLPNGLKPYHFRDLLISLDGKAMYFTGKFGVYLYYFGVYDLENDSLVTVLQTNSEGYLAISPDGNYVYITDPGGYWIEPVPTGKIGVFDTKTNTLLTSISTTDSLHSIRITDKIVITPDGEKAYVSDFECSIVVIDLNYGVMLDTINVVCRNHRMEGLAVGVKR